MSILRAHLVWRKEQKIARGWRDLPEPLFFAEDGGSHVPCDVRKRMKAVLKAAKLPRHFSPHALRHTFATLALDAGKSVYYVSKMLGHKDINLTVGTYTRNVDANQAGALDSLDPAGLVTNL